MLCSIPSMGRRCLRVRTRIRAWVRRLSRERTSRRHRAMATSRLKVLIAAVAVLLVGALATWGFISGRREAAPEADTEQPIRAPQRGPAQNGEPVITLDIAAQRSNGITTARVTNARHPQPLRAFGTVLDLQALTDLSNNSANARAQIEASRAKLSASHTAFERAQELYRDQQNMSAAQL